MKKFLFILILTSCASYKSNKQHSSSQQSQQEQRSEQLKTQQQHQQFSLLQQFAAQDSHAYRMLIRTDGNYRLQPDSGISGTGASIWISGSRQSMTWQQKKQDSSRVDSQLTVLTNVKKDTQQAQQLTKSNTRLQLSSYWLLLPVGLLGLFCYIRWRRK